MKNSFTTSFMTLLTLLALVFSGLGVTPVSAAESLPGYTESVYISGLPVQPSGFAIDQATRTMYFADYANQAGQLRKIDPDKTVSIVTSDFTPSSDFYPYVTTNI